MEGIGNQLVIRNNQPRFNREVNIVKAKIVKLIRTETSEGKGTEKDPARIVVRYWDKKGKMIFKEDPAMGKGET